MRLRLRFSSVFFVSFGMRLCGSLRCPVPDQRRVFAKGVALEVTGHDVYDQIKGSRIFCRNAEVQLGVIRRHVAATKSKLDRAVLRVAFHCDLAAKVLAKRRKVALRMACLE